MRKFFDNRTSSEKILEEGFFKFQINQSNFIGLLVVLIIALFVLNMIAWGLYYKEKSISKRLQFQNTQLGDIAANYKGQLDSIVNTVKQ